MALGMSRRQTRLARWMLGQTDGLPAGKGPDGPAGEDSSRGQCLTEVMTNMLTMLRYNPIPSLTEPFFGRLGNLRREIDRSFESTLSEDLFSTAVTPAMDVKETDEALRLSFEVPGVKPEELSVTLENGVLTVSGEKKLERETGDEKAGVRGFERRYGRFERSLTLPRSVDPDKVTATCENGVLTIELPKTPEARPRKIEISRGSDSRRIGSGTAEQVAA
jgi:HSP20 family protein